MIDATSRTVLVIETYLVNGSIRAAAEVMYEALKQAQEEGEVISR